MSEEINKENKDDSLDLLTSKKKSPGRKRGSKNKPVRAAKSTDEILLLVEEIRDLRNQLEQTNKRVEENKRAPVAVRLENKKKKFSAPAYSGPTKQMKFMRNDQPENPMNVYLRKVVYNAEKNCKEMVDFRKTLVPGKAYELPDPVIDFLNTRSEPTYGERPDPENNRQTITMIVGEKQRCYCVPA